MCSGMATRFRPEHYAVDGLNSLRYNLVDSEARPLYTWLLVKLPPHPSDPNYFSNNLHSGMSRNHRAYSVAELALLTTFHFALSFRRS